MDLTCCNHSGHCVDHPDKPFCDWAESPGDTCPANVDMAAPRGRCTAVSTTYPLMHVAATPSPVDAPLFWLGSGALLGLAVRRTFGSG